VTAAAPIGTNQTRLWGLTAEERLRRIAARQGLEVRDDGEVLVNLGYAFDPSWLKLVAARPGLVVTRRGVPVLANAVDEREQVARAMARNSPLPARSEGLGVGASAEESPADEGLPVLGSSVGPGRGDILAWEESGDLENEELRKKERPFMERLAPETIRALERASYFGAYKGVTDLLTKYLWPEWALVLTRGAARIGMTPNQVSLVGALLCLLATWLFHEGWLTPR